MKIDGECHCGKIAYQAEVDPDMLVLCHCTDCQTVAGAPYRAAIPAHTATLKLLRGEPKICGKTALRTQNWSDQAARAIAPDDADLVSLRAAMGDGFEHSGKARHSTKLPHGRPCRKIKLDDARFEDRPLTLKIATLPKRKGDCLGGSIDVSAPSVPGGVCQLVENRCASYQRILHSIRDNPRSPIGMRRESSSHAISGVGDMQALSPVYDGMLSMIDAGPAGITRVSEKFAS